MDGMSEPVSREEFKRLDKQVNGNGQPGIKQDIEDIRDTLSAMRGAADATQKTQDARHRENSTKINLIIALTGVATLGILAATLIVSVMALRHASLNVEQIFHSQSLDPVYASSQQPSQSAGGPAQPTY